MNSKSSDIFDKSWVLSIFYSKCCDNNNRIFKEQEESIKILIILGLMA